MSNKIYKAITSLAPNRLIYQNNIYTITEIDDDHIINSYEIFLDNDDRIIEVRIDADHPNSDPSTDIFCLPEELKNRYLTKKLIKEIENVIKTYNMNHPYFPPWGYISYMKYDSIEYYKKQQKKDNSFITKTYEFINKIRNFNVNIID